MTDAVQAALIAAVGGAVTTAISSVTLALTRRVRRQASENWQLSHRIQQQTDGNVSRLLEVKEAEARERERRAWDEAFEAGRRAEVSKTRRAEDRVNDEEPHE